MARSLLTRWLKSPRPTHTTRPRFQPQLVALEGRDVPAIFTVTSLADAGPGTLRAAIVDANQSAGADTVQFVSPGTISLTTGEIAITDPLTIIAPMDGVSVSAQLASRIFNITANTTLNGFTLTQGRADRGGAITMTGASLGVIDCSFIDNGTVPGYGQGGLATYGSGNSAGGAICNEGNGNVDITRSYFGFNISRRGPSVAVYGTGNLTFTNSTMNHSWEPPTYYSAGTEVYTSVNSTGTLRVENCTRTSFINGYGGVFHRDGTGPTFLTNTITDSTDLPYSSPGTVTVTTCLHGDYSFLSLGTYGGRTPYFPIGASSPARNAGTDIGLTVDQGGHTRQGLPDIGAGEFVFEVTNTNDSGTGSLRQALLELKNYPSLGAQIYNIEVGPLFLMDFTTPKSIVLTSGPLVIPSGNQSLIGPGEDKLTITGNDAQQILHVESSGFVYVQGITFTHGKAARGGAVQSDEGADLQIENCVFTNNVSTGGIADAVIGGGAIAAKTNKRLKITESTLTGNSSASDGGAIHVTGDLYAYHTTISNNSAPRDGGSILGSTADLMIDYSTVADNSAGRDGGAITLRGGTLNMTCATLSGNTAFRDGGAVVVRSVTGSDYVQLQQSTLAANTAGRNGGALLMNSANGNFDIYNCTIAKNAALVGGGLHVTLATATGYRRLFSTIVADNTGGATPDLVANQSVFAYYTAFGSMAGFTPLYNPAANLVGLDYKLGSLASNGGITRTIVPASSSPLRGAGINDNDYQSDQRGLRRELGVVDIGAVEIMPYITAITRSAANPTAAASVTWTVTCEDGITGLSKSNFVLTGPGAIGSTITAVTGSATTYTVTASTGKDGLLGLQLANATGVNPGIEGAPFNGQNYIIDKVPLTVSGLRFNHSKLGEQYVGSGTFTATVDFSEAMDPTISPTLSFPVESPGGSLTPAAGAWVDSDSYRFAFDFADLNIELPNIDVRISGGRDTGGTLFTERTFANAFSIDTHTPDILSITREQATPSVAATVSWKLTFSEAVTGLAAANFTLPSTGLGTGPAITAITGSGTIWIVTASTGSGTGTMRLNLSNTGGIKDLFGNTLNNTDNGAVYDIDNVVPTVTLTPSTAVVNDSLVGPNGFHITARFSEPMNPSRTPLLTFPVEVPVGSITFSGGVWVDSQTYRADYTVADLGTTLSDIDVALVASAADPAGNVVAPVVLADMIDLDTQNAIVSFVYSASPAGIYRAGQTLDVNLFFSEAVTLEGQLTLTFDTGATATLSAGGSTFASAAVAYTVSVGELSNNLKVTNIALSSGTFTDAAGNTFELTVPTANTTGRIIDGVPPDDVTLDGVTPLLTGFTVNNGDSQRSRITTLALDFNQPVTPAMFNALGSIQLRRTALSSNATGGIGDVVQTGPEGLNHITITQGATTRLVLTFDNNGSFTNSDSTGVESGSLADGNWQLIVAGFVSPLNDPNLRRLFGDSTSTTGGTIDGSDLAVFGNVFSSASVAFDFNNDGTVDGADLVVFGNRFGNTL